MGLANSSKRARNYTSTTNQPQGGGNKKAGFPYQIGRSAWTSIALGNSNYAIRCCSLRNLQFTANPNVRMSRPTGSAVPNTYFG
jgi:hypothetical protein